MRGLHNDGQAAAEARRRVRLEGALSTSPRQIRKRRAIEKPSQRPGRVQCTMRALHHKCTEKYTANVGDAHRYWPLYTVSAMTCLCVWHLPGAAVLISSCEEADV